MKTKITFLSLLLCCLTALDQIGINTETPNQALDVNGKIQIGNDAAPNTEGSMRYNESTTNFEG